MYRHRTGHPPIQRPYRRPVTFNYFDPFDLGSPLDRDPEPTDVVDAFRAWAYDKLKRICLISILAIPGIVLAMSLMSVLYYGAETTVVVRHMSCSFPPVRHSLDVYGLDWCKRPQSSPGSLLPRDPWAGGTITNLFAGLPALSKVNEVFTDLRRDHIWGLQNAVATMSRKGVLVNTELMAKSLIAIDTSLMRGANASTNLVYRTDKLLARTEARMSLHRTALLRQFEIHDPVNRPKFSYLYRLFMPVQPFLARLHATETLTAAVRGVAQEISTNVNDTLSAAEETLNHINIIEEELANFQSYMDNETREFDGDCAGVRFWQDKPLKCYSISLLNHRSVIEDFSEKESLFKRVLRELIHKLHVIKDSVDQSVTYGLDGDGTERSVLNTNEILALSDMLIEETGQIMELIQSRRTKWYEQRAVLYKQKFGHSEVR